MKKLITYSVWGDNPKYCVGAVKNAQQRAFFYPTWISRFHVHKDVPVEYIDELKKISGTEIVIEDRPPNWTALFWRFEDISDPDVSVIICRDTDCRLSWREVAAVNEFLSSKKRMHIMRDHPWHGFPVLGGMFGLKSGLINNMKFVIDSFNPSDNYGTDYAFWQKLLPMIHPEEILVHDEFFSGKPFPLPRNGLQFVGQVFDENDNTVQEHLNILQKHLNK